MYLMCMYDVCNEVYTFYSIIETGVSFIPMYHVYVILTKCVYVLPWYVLRVFFLSIITYVLKCLHRNCAMIASLPPPTPFDPLLTPCPVVDFLFT
jgi:hypothetical protein